MKNIIEQAENILSLFNKKDIENQIVEIDANLNSADWSNPKTFGLSKKRDSLQNDLLTISKTSAMISFLKENSQEDLELFKSDIEDFEKFLESVQMNKTLNDKNDKLNAIVSIQAGSGGTESKNWANILLRMYIRFAEQNGFTVSDLDISRPEDYSSECISGAQFKISGEFAYGFLKNESGVHRLVRNSPYDSQGRRHTSFAAVQVIPEIEDDDEIIIEEKDMTIQRIRSSGAGGQNVNKVASAIRLHYIPLNIMILSKSTRDQHKNLEIAKKRLKSQIAAIKQKQTEEDKQNAFDALDENSWGSQIRSYVMSPIPRITDNRSEYHGSNPDKVLDGDLFPVIKSVLFKK